MHRTYELYGRRENRDGHIRVVTCREQEIMRHAHELLEEDDVHEVDVREGGRHLFTLTR